jgi:hypothetical protein
VVRGVGIEPLLDRPGRHTHRHAPYGRLEGFEVALVDVNSAYERFDLGRDFRGEDRLEPFFSAPCSVCSSASSSASAARSQIFQ